MRMGRLIAPALIWTVLPAAAPAADQASIAFELRRTCDVVIPVSIAGHGGFRFLLDTGSTRSAIADRVAVRLRLQDVGETRGVTPTRQVSRPLVIAPVAFGPVSTRVAAMVLARDELKGDVDGLIGSDLLAAQPFAIDYVNRRVLFEASAGQQRGTVVPLAHGEHGFHVPLRGSDPLQTWRFIPDTGTTGFVLFARKGRELPDMTPLDPLPLRAVGGLRVGRSVLLQEMRIGNISLREQAAVVIAGEVDERLGDGLLPLHLFAQVTFDTPRGTLTIVARRGA